MTPEPRQPEARILSPEVQQDQVRRLQTGDVSARAGLMESHYRLGRAIARRAFRGGRSLPPFVELDDATHEASLLMEQRYWSFNEARGFKVTTHAATNLHQRVMRPVHNLSDVVRLPDHVRETAFQEGVDAGLSVSEQPFLDEEQKKLLYTAVPVLNESIVRLEAVGHEYPADGLGTPVSFSQETTRTLEAGAARQLTGSDRFITDPEGPVDPEIGWQERISEKHRIQPYYGAGNRRATGPDPASYDPEAAAVQLDQQATVFNILNTVLKPRERTILAHRFGLGGAPPLTREQLGELFGVTSRRIGQLEKGAYRKIRSQSHVILRTGVLEYLRDGASADT